MISLIGLFIIIGTCIVDKINREKIKADKRLKQLIIISMFSGIVITIAGIFV